MGQRQRLSARLGSPWIGAGIALASGCACALAGCGRSDLFPPAGGAPASAAADGGRVRRSPDGPCGPLIDDIEDGTGRICQGPEGRRGVWYAFNDDVGMQWPAPTTPGVAIATSEIPGGRDDSQRAMHTYGMGYSYWGAGIGFDLAFDGTTYGLYDASAYSGVTFWARGTPRRGIDLRISTAKTTLPKYGGACPMDNCPPLFKRLLLGDDWAQYWVPFSALPGLETKKMTNMQFLVEPGYALDSFDFWIDDVSFFVGRPGCCPAACAAGVSMPDATLAALVRDAAGLGRGAALACADVCSLLSLEVDQAGVGSLAGLQCLSSLRSLSLPGGSVRDLAPLAALPLGTLSLPDHHIADVALLAGRTGLTSLDLSGNQIGAFDALASLPRLQGLGLARNRLTGALPALALPALTGLDLSSNAITDVGALIGAPALVTLDLSSNAITDIGPVAALPELVRLFVGANRITDLAPIAGLRKLQQLWLWGNEIVDLSPLAGLPALFQLNISQNSISDLSPLAGIPVLNDLNISQNPISDLSPLAGIPLESLYASGDRLQSLGSLHGMALWSVDVSHNQISDPGVPADVTFTPVAYAPPPSLDLSANQIRDLAPLVASPGLYAGMQILLHDNPIVCKAQAANIAKLRARTITIDICP